MKVAILNYCGTVGKTTLAAHLLKPRMIEAPIMAIESINDDVSNFGLESEKLKGDKYMQIYKRLLVHDDCIIDVGASNVENFLDRMIKFEGSHEEIDVFIVPITPGQKEQRESVSTIASLLEIGITVDKIRVILNRVQDEPRAEFVTVFGAANKLGFDLNENCSVYENEVYDLLNKRSKTIDSVLNDQTDYKAKLKKAITDEDDREINVCTDFIALKSLSSGAKRNLDIVFSEIFK